MKLRAPFMAAMMAMGVPVLAFLMACSAPAQETSQLSQRLDAFLSAAETSHFSGAVLVARGDEVLFSKGYGFADYESGVKVTPETVFNIGSVTKQFTAAAILKLVEHEHLDLSDTLGALFENVPEDKAGITVHQLLTHTAGISRQDLGFRYDPASKEDFLAAFFASTLATDPGTRHEYANTGYVLLAAIVEQVSGQTFEAYLQQHLLEPAGLSQTGYLQPDWRSERIANGYYFDLPTGAWKSWGNTFQQWGVGPVTWFGIGKGDLHSTTGDLYNWHKALRDGTVLAPETVALLQTPHVPENEKDTTFYGYGWSIQSTNDGGRIITHNGSNGLFFADFIRFVDEDLVVILLTNVSQPESADSIAWHLARMARDESYVPPPIAPLSYELVYRFMDGHTASEAGGLPSFMETGLGRPLENAAILNRVGFQLLREDKCDWSTALLQLNTDLFPTDGNLRDSLGEGLLACGQSAEAADAFRKALELAPEENCYWCQNANEKLGQIFGAP
ncbi:serine hydrolase [Hyphomonas sp.]|uniref:serine hydrolase n=1 Tax=Hyphomonas sp. TaxID=87 RepID=UPI00352923D7